MGSVRNFYYEPGSLTNLRELQSRAIFLSSGPNTDKVTIHHHLSSEPCGSFKHESYPGTGH